MLTFSRRDVQLSAYAGPANFSEILASISGRGFITVVRLKTDGTMKLGLGRLQREVGPDKALAVAHKLLKSINLPAIQRWAEEGYFVDGKNLKNVWGSAKRLTVILPDEQAVKQLKDGLAALAVTVPQ